MKNIILKTISVLFFVLFTYTVNNAAPLNTSSSLPLNHDDLEVFADYADDNNISLYEVIQIFEEIQFFPDHRNFNDSLFNKTYYYAPFYAPEEPGGNKGSLVVEERLLSLLDEIDDLYLSIGVNPVALRGVQNKIDIAQKKLERLYGLLNASDGKRQKNILKLISLCRKKIEKMEEEKKHQNNLLNQSLSGLKFKIQRDIAHSLAQAANRIGEKLNQDERIWNKDPEKFITEIFPGIRMRITNRTLGVLSVRFGHGLDDSQRNILSLYRMNHPEIIIDHLPHGDVKVEQLTQISDNNFLSAFSLIKTINGKKDGLCGNTNTSCKVIIEYTEAGARMVSQSVMGSTVIPIAFSAEIMINPPELKNKISCSFNVDSHREFYKRSLLSVAQNKTFCYTDDAGTNDLTADEIFYAAALLSHESKSLYWEDSVLSMKGLRNEKNRLKQLFQYGNLPSEFSDMMVWQEIIGDNWLETSSGIAALRHRRKFIMSEEFASFSGSLFTSTDYLDILSNNKLELQFDGFPVVCWGDPLNGKQIKSAGPCDSSQRFNNTPMLIDDDIF